MITAFSTTALLFAFKPPVFWPWVEGAAILLIGLAALSWSDVLGSPGLERLILFGPMLYAIAIAVFSGDHFGAPRAVATIVPSWMPWHLFWTYFVGAALIAAALSLAAHKESQLAAALTGLMLALFVLMIHIPNCFRVPHDRSLYTIAARECLLSAGAFAYAAALAQDWRRGTYRGWGLALGSSVAWKKMANIARIVIGVVIVDYGIQQFLFPSYAPGIPQQGPEIIQMPSWIPAHVLWTYASGAIFLVCGIALLLNRRPRLIAEIFAAAVLVITALVYVPATIKNPANIGIGLNYIAIHFMLAGAALMLAQAMPARFTDKAEVAVGVREHKLTAVRDVS
ncbi:MAG TPA: DoxX family membrane protein [Candidatus Acidoferrum sp.]|nr:DoxX family membrane protein [Candidatus Acidoferrum sp.]